MTIPQRIRRWWRRQFRTHYHCRPEIGEWEVRRAHWGGLFSVSDRDPDEALRRLNEWEDEMIERGTL